MGGIEAIPTQRATQPLIVFYETVSAHDMPALSITFMLSVEGIHAGLMTSLG
jgi:hypothetical protein